MKNAERIVFLDYLRAIACLLVVTGHVYLMGYNGHVEMNTWVPSIKDFLFGADAPQRNIFSAPALWLAINTGINVGILGVSIFFLISGFVILRAVDRERVSTFIVRRIFRIYPVSFAAVFLAGAVTAWYCWLTGTTSPDSLASMISSAFVANGFVHKFEALPVLWSLEVELFFYLGIAGLAAIGRLGFAALLQASVACMAFTFLANAPQMHALLSPALARILVHISFASLQITFLLIGSVLYRMTTDSRQLLGGFCLCMAIGIFLMTRFGYLALFGADSGGADVPNGAAAFVVFILALSSGLAWKWLRPLKFVADISYPLYLVHVPLAWISLAILSGHGFGMLSAGIITGLLVVFVAWVIHVTVEVNAQAFARSLSRKPAAVVTELGVRG